MGQLVSKCVIVQIIFRLCVNGYLVEIVTLPLSDSGGLHLIKGQPCLDKMPDYPQNVPGLALFLRQGMVIASILTTVYQEIIYDPML